MPKSTTWLERLKSPARNAVERLSRRVAKEETRHLVYSHDSARLMETLLECANYAAANMAGAAALSSLEAVRGVGLAAAPRRGLFLEFGVWSGETLNMIADHVGPDVRVHGFDSFRGLPEDWVGDYHKGRFDLEGRMPQVRPNAVLHPGWFADTLPPFAAEEPGDIAFLHVDCDLYSSTKTVFDHLGDRLAPGSVIVFDEYFNYVGWRDHEYKAFQELVHRRRLGYRYLAYNTHERNVAVQICDRTE